MAWKKLAMAMLAILLVIVCLIPGNAQAAAAAPAITSVSPANNATVTTQTPVITAQYTTPSGERPSVSLVLDGDLDVSSLATRTNWTSTNLTYVVRSDMLLDYGQHNITLTVTDSVSRTSTTMTWTFFVVKYTPPLITIQQLLMYVVVGLGIGLVAFGIALLVLKRTRNFSLRKYLKKNPIPKKIYYTVVPAVAAFFFVLVALALFEGSNISPFLDEYVMVIAIVILLLPYAIYVQIETKKRGNYERAFSQFLYEMADAMRGGIDPSKAVIELSKTDDSILSKHLKIAAKGLEMGRPFEEMIDAMVRPIDSKLIKRYASLIGESAKIGGEISQVVHRAAKDMDDLIKIEEERSRDLAIQGTTIYISFAVLLVVIYLLTSIYPSLGQVDFGHILSGANSGLKETASSDVAGKMSYATLKQRFLDLTIVTGLGSGLIIGLFTKGNIKYGLIHALGMMLAGAVFLMIMMS